MDLVVNATSLSRSGLSDFLLQRVSAVVLGLYALCIVGFLIVNPDVDQIRWVQYMTSPVMLIFGTLAILSFAVHAWIGMWTVGTDYLSEHKMGKHASFWRLLYQVFVVVIVFTYLLFGLGILWRLPAILL
ncbi:MAG: succinate dehydrogenase, hydrophobic membrane anchor protein [Gammaproteobacteria bacterium]|nr:succinate dehydrogenase, hydrophobic membrane anchor protein [Gammaproteobacteria bacterium]